jgi:hypothetical protein
MSRSNNRGRRRRPHRRPEAEQATPQPEIQQLPPEPAAYPNTFPPEPLPERRVDARRVAGENRVRPGVVPANEENEGELRVGCPMLTRTKMALPTLADRHVPRCSLAWAIHSEEEMAFCLLTEDLVDCWQAHPERIPALESLLAGEASAAD